MTTFTTRLDTQDAPTATLLDAVATFDGVSPVIAFVEQLAAVRGILPALELRGVAHNSNDQYVVSGQFESVAVSLTGLRSPLSGYELSLNMVGPQHRWRVRIGGDELARPSEIVRFDRAGAHAQLDGGGDNGLAADVRAIPVHPEVHDVRRDR